MFTIFNFAQLVIGVGVSIMWLFDKLPEIIKQSIFTIKNQTIKKAVIIIIPILPLLISFFLIMVDVFRPIALNIFLVLRIAINSSVFVSSIFYVILFYRLKALKRIIDDVEEIAELGYLSSMTSRR